MPDTLAATGTRRLTLVPSPNSPFSLRPQTQTLPLALSSRLCVSVATITVGERLPAEAPVSTEAARTVSPVRAFGPDGLNTPEAAPADRVSAVTMATAQPDSMATGVPSKAIAASCGGRGYLYRRRSDLNGPVLARVAGPFHLRERRSIGEAALDAGVGRVRDAHWPRGGFRRLMRGRSPDPDRSLLIFRVSEAPYCGDRLDSGEAAHLDGSGDDAARIAGDDLAPVGTKRPDGAVGAQRERGRGTGGNANDVRETGYGLRGGPRDEVGVAALALIVRAPGPHRSVLLQGDRVAIAGGDVDYAAEGVHFDPTVVGLPISSAKLSLGVIAPRRHAALARENQ